MKKTKWLVCLLKAKGKRKITVKVLSPNYVPKEGVALQVVGTFWYKDNAQLMARYPDTKKAWGTMLQVTDEGLWDYLPHR